MIIDNRNTKQSANEWSVSRKPPKSATDSDSDSFALTNTTGTMSVHTD